MSEPATSMTKSLEEVRREIDQIDDAMHDLLMRRADLVAEVADAKARAASLAGDGSFIAIRPAREAEVLRRLVGRHQGPLPAEVIVRLWREIMSAKTRIQGPLTVDVFGADDPIAIWDLARFYYGGATPMSLHDNAKAALKRVFADRSALGVFPFPGAYEGGDWWAALASAPAGGPRVVALLPFLETDGVRPAFVTAHAAFEPSGQDVSLFIAETRGGVSEARILGELERVGLAARRLATTQVNGSGESSIVLHLLAHDGFVEPGDPRLLLEGNAVIDRLTAIGGYAQPIRAGDAG